MKPERRPKMLKTIAKALPGLMLLPFRAVSHLVKEAALWGTWAALVMTTLISLSAGVILCVGGNLLAGMIVIGVAVFVEWGLM